MAMTPMMQQYFEVKDQYKDYILFYRLGDFYEMFFEDAKIASRELDLTLTGRDCGEEERAPMCGIPFHSYEPYVGKLIEKGFKVAICEQMEDPSLAKGLVKREVIRVVTPGTVTESDLISESKNNYLAAAFIGDHSAALAYADITTSKVSVTGFDEKDFLDELSDELAAVSPAEVLLNVPEANASSVFSQLRDRLGSAVTVDASLFDPDNCRALVSRQYSIESAALLQTPGRIIALGALLGYVVATQKKDSGYLKELHNYEGGQYLQIDQSSRRNLELCETMRSKEKKGSLLWVVDKTQTSPGARMLRSWMEHPLVSTRKIRQRQLAVSEMYSAFGLREELHELLADVMDLERLTTRIVFGTANAKDLRAVCRTLSVLPQIKRVLAGASSEPLRAIDAELETMEDLADLIRSSIAEDPPFLVREGGMIAPGYSEDVDRLRLIMTDGKSWISGVEAREREATGIRTLKIGYNRVFGYYIEVSKSFTDQVPETYIRKQTLVNGERYITDELKDMEATILGAKDKLFALEYDLFCGIRDKVAAQADRLQRVSSLLSELDCYQSLANIAVRNRYVCPEVDDGSVIEIKAGRHPVVEQFTKDTYFVPNDTYLDTDLNRLMLITGPNMAGKSTYMRQVALITILAQIGSFVPAESARIGIVDQVFTRVGASDDLSSGQSTFMLEMSEVAYILRHATQRSLIIYDEIGRGTSTYDGLSIARAVAEYTMSKKIGAKTLFCTHYHELTSLEQDQKGCVNYHIAAKKKGDDIIFLRTIVRGSTDDSYGIEVSKLAGVPNEVVRRAKEVLAVIESTVPDVNVAKETNRVEEPDNLSISDLSDAEVLRELREMNVDALTPLEALNLLNDIKKRLL